MPSTPAIPDVLASRYASTAMATIWSPEHKIVLERQLWVAVLKAQRDLGIDVPDGVVEAYEAVVEQVDLDSIRDREKVTRHDVKARIEEFSDARRPRARAQGHDEPRPHRERRAAADPALAASVVARQGRRGAGAARRARHRVRRARDRRALAQRRGADDHAGQALRERGRRAARRAAPRSRSSSRATRCAASRARSAPRRTCSTCSTATATSSSSSRTASPRTSASRTCSPASVRSTRARSTTTSSRRSCSSRPGRRRSPPRCGSWPATSSSPRASSRGRSARRPCRTR